MDYQPGLKAILDNSNTLVSWALAVGGASVAAMVSTSYERPKTRRGRMIYLPFPVAWCFLGRSIYAGEQISRRFIAAQLVDPATVREISKLMNRDFASQWNWLLWGLAFLLVWLVLFVGWWIWYAPEKRPSPRTPTRTSAGE